MKVVVTGGRGFKDALCVAKELAALNPTHIAHGGATGADDLAASWAKGAGVSTTEFPANWEEHGRAAGPIRNRKMLEWMQPDIVLAFPGGRGTADCVSQARRMGIEVREVQP